MQHHHITELDSVHALSDVKGGALITTNSIFFDNVCLRFDGELQAWSLKKDKLPEAISRLDSGFELENTCFNYLRRCQEVNMFFRIEEVFPEHYLYDDFDAVPIGGKIWQAKIDVIQAQIDLLDDVYATDVQVIQQIADSIATAGNHTAFVAQEILVETTRAVAAEQANAAAVVTEKDRAELVEASNALSVVTERVRAEAAEGALDVRVDVLELDPVTSAQVNTLISTATDALVAGAPGQLQTLNDLAAALDDNASFATSITALVGAKVDQASYDTKQSSQDSLVLLNTGKRDNTANDARYDTKAQVNTKLADYTLTSALDTEQDSQDALILLNTGKRDNAANDARYDTKTQVNTKLADYTLTSALNAQQSGQDALISTNTAKTGITTQQSQDITANSLKVGFTDALVALAPAVVANSDKTGITSAQATAIGENSSKVGFTDALVALAPAVVANSDKTGITSAQATAIGENTLKVGITSAEQTKVAYVDVSSGLTALFATKQNLIANDHLSISHTAGLQAAIDAKHPSLDTASLFHDTSNNRLGVGLVAPTSMVHIHDTGGNAELKVSRDLSDRHVTISSDSVTHYGNGAGTTAWRFRQVTADPIQFETSNTPALRVEANGNVNAKMDLVVDQRTTTATLLVTGAPPADKDADGVAGEVRFDGVYIYLCDSTNHWVRTPALLVW